MLLFVFYCVHEVATLSFTDFRHIDLYYQYTICLTHLLAAQSNPNEKFSSVFVLFWKISLNGFFRGLVLIFLLAPVVSNPVTNMFWFFPKKKPGFAKGTVTITLRYSGSNLTKIYCTDYELFAAVKQGKKAKRKMGAKFAICKRGYKSPLRCRPWCQRA